MFCYQCEQTVRGKETTGCNSLGVCGKGEETANLQDLLVYSLTGLGIYASCAREANIIDPEIDGFVTHALFTTLTNVNFDNRRLSQYIQQAIAYRDQLKARYLEVTDNQPSTPATSLEVANFKLAATDLGLLEQAETIGWNLRFLTLGEEVSGLYGLVLFGLKGVAAYADHAKMMGFNDVEIYAQIHKCLAFLATESTEANSYLEWAFKLGEVNFKTMGLLDNAHTELFGHPEPTKVRISTIKGHAILVSGHDIHDLEKVLEQTKGTGINVYTHGEMLPANAYPKIKQHSHLAGNYGGAWQDQQREFDEFPGSIVLTSNCLITPRASYANRLFTMNAVGFSEIKHITNQDFSPAIKATLEMPGFTTSEPEKFITIGFARQSVLNVAPEVINAVKAGAIKRFFLIGGCDGAHSKRSYYTEFAKKVPQDCVILTLGCGKYRFNKEEFGDINGIPRLLDIGQCSDTYSAVQIALALADAFKCEVNQLPLSLIISWFEQKAVAVLLSLLYLGIKNIYLGPTLPGFLTPSAVQLLVDKFNLTPISTPENDLATILNA